MRKAIIISCLIFSLAIFSSCLRTLYPIFLEDDVIFNESLIGYWNCTDSKGNDIGSYEFKPIPKAMRSELPAGIIKISDSGYLVTRNDSLGHEIGRNIVFLAKIGKNQYLDFYPVETPLQKTINKHFRDHYIKVHTSYRCDVKNTNYFELREFDYGFLEGLIANNQINMTLSGNKLIESTTQELQEYILRYGDNPKAYGSATKCSRVVNY
ncbi:MAG TPA: hypothetical protein VF144_20790 [Chitinophagaceae bacterium]